ncbi:hypothetical protein VULLAG_LOCUS19435 [Vulpes lagopus]
MTCSWIGDQMVTGPKLLLFAPMTGQLVKTQDVGVSYGEVGSPPQTGMVASHAEEGLHQTLLKIEMPNLYQNNVERRTDGTNSFGMSGFPWKLEKGPSLG